MNDGSRQRKHSGLRNEWSILIQSFIEELPSVQPKNQDFTTHCKERGVTAQDLEKYSKYLSERRKSINKQIECVKTEIEEKYATIENLHLVKSNTAPIFEDLERLNRQGENLSKEMIKIDKEVKSLRIAENFYDN